jgi:hypothetical protein
MSKDKWPAGIKCKLCKQEIEENQQVLYNPDDKTNCTHFPRCPIFRDPYPDMRFKLLNKKIGDLENRLGKFFKKNCCCTHSAERKEVKADRWLRCIKCDTVFGLNSIMIGTDDVGRYICGPCHRAERDEPQPGQILFFDNREKKKTLKRLDKIENKLKQIKNILC